MQRDKERIENDLRKMGMHPKNKQQLDKLNELESESELVNKNIGSIKQKLRELNAL